jgi:K(+)-stimulated pyrophosphate-energized sodium pump
VDIATAASLKEMMAPGLMVVLTPILVGWLFGVHMLSGVLIGALVTAVMFAVSMANSGGAWDNAKKYIESGHLGGRGTEAHKASVVGDTVGDPFKDTSGPALNILIKLMAIISLVFAPFIATQGGVLLRILGQ